ncbi:unnamed protein product [Thlaspi arvense]|uniref:Uncharacterized protein n=1 Tax=Thlaspi arvense TaxID=13288 RepID=A0AAU9S3K8_THLAR|nr:unnamed protein product [Thlaspi arvense]
MRRLAVVNSLLKRNNSLLQRHGLSQIVAQRTNSVHETETKIPEIPPFNYSPPPYDGPSTAEITAKRREFLSPALFHFYNTPLNVVEGKMQYVFDETGRRYLDAFGGIATVSCGHSHPEVVESVIKQLKLIQHSTILYLNHTISDFAEALVSNLPGDLKVVFFTNSGTEANELAMMMARLYTGCNDIVSLRNSYHGNAAATMGATAQSNWKFNVVQGVGGIVELAPGYLPAVYDTVRRAGGVCIADEVQSGFARTGTHFWGFQSHGVIPDIVTVAKVSPSSSCIDSLLSSIIVLNWLHLQGIGNGIPLGAVVTRPEIAGVLSRRSYFNTFGGNPMCTAAGHAVLRVIKEEKLQENAFLVGSHLKRRLTQLKNKHELIGDVRGRGLMLGVEFVRDRDLKTPAKTETLHLMDQMKEMGVLVGKGGFYGNVFRITPPLCFTLPDADFLVDVMDHALSKM